MLNENKYILYKVKNNKKIILSDIFVIDDKKNIVKIEPKDKSVTVDIVKKIINILYNTNDSIVDKIENIMRFRSNAYIGIEHVGI